MAKPPTVEDVALAAGVSRQTVSNVLNTPGIVREKTRERDVLDGGRLRHDRSPPPSAPDRIVQIVILRARQPP